MKLKENNDAVRRNPLPGVPEIATSQFTKLVPAQDSTDKAIPFASGLDNRQITSPRQQSSPKKAEETVVLTKAFAEVDSKVDLSLHAKITKDAWIADLNNKAVIIGPAFSKKVRPVATETEWVAALNEAIMAGRVVTPKRPTISKDEWISALDKAAHESSPIFQVKSEEPQLWAASTMPSASNPFPMLWSKDTVPTKPIIKSLFTSPTTSARKPLLNSTHELPKLNSTELWKSIPVIRNDVNWLTTKSTGLKRANTWSPAKARVSMKMMDGKTLWSASTFEDKNQLSENLFAHLDNAIGKRSPSAANRTGLQQLQSTKLFTPTSTAPQVTNWLETSVSVSEATPKPLQRSLTWSSRNKKPVILESTSSLWSPSATSDEERLERSFAPESDEQWLRKPRKAASTIEEATVVLDRSETLWKSSTVAQQVERSWLL